MNQIGKQILTFIHSLLFGNSTGTAGTSSVSLRSKKWFESNDNNHSDIQLSVYIYWYILNRLYIRVHYVWIKDKHYNRQCCFVVQLGQQLEYETEYLRSFQLGSHFSGIFIISHLFFYISVEIYIIHMPLRALYVLLLW